MTDETRKRDRITIDGIKKEMSVQEAMLATCSVLSGSPMKQILNREGKVDEAAESVIKAIGL
jgi:adenylate kinase